MVQGVEIDDNGCLVDRNPATNEIIGRIKITTEEEVHEMVKNAKQAQVAWSMKPLDDRISQLKVAIEKLTAHAQELTELVTKEMGKIRSEAKEEVDFVCGKGEDGTLRLIAEANAAVSVENGLILRDPHGVVLCLTPWNFPIDEILNLALPALAAGNTVIVKPSEVVPMCGQLVVDALASALPEHVLQVAQGDGKTGASLVNADIQMVAMTGSSAVGRKIMAACASDLKRLVLELGGKDPMVVFKDADLEKAAQDAVANSLANCGQVCCSVERVYIEAAVKDEFEQRVAELAQCWTAGNPEDPEVKIGPLVSEMQRAHVKEQVDKAVANGAKIIAQGKIKEVPAEAADYYFPATVLVDVGQDFELTRKETFGPVIAITTFSGDEAEAVTLANDSEYGLAAYVYSQDMDKAQRVAMGIKAGQVGINNYSMACAPTACPWSGSKGSGFGCHSGMTGWSQFSVPKSLVFDTGVEAAARAAM